MAITKYALERIGGAGATIYGPKDPSERGGVLAFTFGEVHPHDIATIIDQEGVAIRAGHHCAQPLMRRYAVPAMARASFYVYNTNEDVDALVDALGEAKGWFA
jgi:cysteine desulfurase/selenocysteine lyase